MTSFTAIKLNIVLLFIPGFFPVVKIQNLFEDLTCVFTIIGMLAILYLTRDYALAKRR